MTMKPNIVFLDSFSLGDNDLTPIKELGNYSSYENTLPEQVLERSREADIIITNKVRFGEEQFRQLPRLKQICVAATGMNIIDLNAAADYGVVVNNVVGYSTHAVTETTIGGAITMLRNAVFFDQFIKNGDYTRSGRWVSYLRPTRQLHGLNWGVVGLGNIGRNVARIVREFGCEVAYASTSGVVREEDYRLMDLNELLAWSDIVSVHCPLNEHTVNLIATAQLALMKPSAILINVARGGVVNEQALCDALNDNRLAGAVFDVFTTEPMAADNPLLHVEDPYKLLLSPHTAWAAKASIDVLIRGVADNIRRFLQSQADDSLGNTRRA